MVLSKPDIGRYLDAPAQLILFKLTERLNEADLYGAHEDDVFQFQSDPMPRRDSRIQSIGFGA